MRFSVQLHFLAFGYEMDMYDREEFGAFLAEKFSSNDRGTSGVVYKDLGDKIKTVIRARSLQSQDHCRFRTRQSTLTSRSKE